MTYQSIENKEWEDNMTYKTIDLDSLGRNDITRGQSPNGYKNQRRQDKKKEYWFSSKSWMDNVTQYAS